MAYSTAEELKSTVKALNNKNQSQTDLPNDFTTTRLLNVEINQTNKSSASCLTDASNLISTATITNTVPVSAITKTKENTTLNSKSDLSYSTTANCSKLINTPPDLELYQLIDYDYNSNNLTKILNFEENLKEIHDTNMINYNEKEIWDEIVDVLENGSNSKNDMFINAPLLPDIHSFDSYFQDFEYNTYENNTVNASSPATITNVLVKDEEVTTYDCINPQRVHAFSSDTIDMSINSLPDTSINFKMNENFLNINFNNNNDNNSYINNNNNDSNNNNNNNSSSNNNNNSNNFNNISNNFENFNFGDGNTATNNNNLNHNFNSCDNTYSKKKIKALKLKIDPHNNINNKTIQTPDIIKIVEALQQEKEKENLLPTNTFTDQMIYDDSNNSNNSFEFDNSPIESPILGVGIQEFDSKSLTNQMSPCDSAISNCTSVNNNILLSPAKYESPLSIGGSSMNSYSDDANASTSYLNSSPPTPTSQISHTCSEYSSTQFSETTLSQQLKKKRGRPALDHSSPPTSEQLKNADPNKRKYLEQRYKNNEASRISRRNRKRKDEQEKKEEEDELEKNKILKIKHAKLTKRHEFLKDYLRSVIQSG